MTDGYQLIKRSILCATFDYRKLLLLPIICREVSLQSVIANELEQNEKGELLIITVQVCVDMAGEGMEGGLYAARGL